jgi:hypothetical protein
VKISKLIAKLQVAQAEHGDIDVHVWAYSSNSDGPVCGVETIDPTTWPKPKRQPKYLLLES